LSKTIDFTDSLAFYGDSPQLSKAILKTFRIFSKTQFLGLHFDSFFTYISDDISLLNLLNVKHYRANRNYRALLDGDYERNSCLKPRSWVSGQKFSKKFFNSSICHITCSAIRFLRNV